MTRSESEVVNSWAWARKVETSMRKQTMVETSLGTLEKYNIQVGTWTTHFVSVSKLIVEMEVICQHLYGARKRNNGEFLRERQLSRNSNDGIDISMHSNVGY